MRRRKNYTTRNIIIVFCVMIFLFATGFSAFQTVININATGNVKKILTVDDLKTIATSSSHGLYRDIWENNRYIYKGISPDNYIQFNNEAWRIYSIEENSINIPFDQVGERTAGYCTEQKPFRIAK